MEKGRAEKAATAMRVAARSVLPLYHRIARVIRLRIESGEYVENGLLPAEEELCAEFKVSRITIRQALAILKQDGLIYSKAGYGTVVRAESKGPKYIKVVGSLADLVNFGLETNFKPIAKKLVAAPEFVAEKLACPKGTRVYYYSGIRCLKTGEVFGYLEMYLHRELGQHIPVELIKTKPLFSLVSEVCGVKIAEAEQIITAVNADRQLALLLKTKRGAPLLKVIRTYFSEENQPIEVAISYYNVAKFEPVMRVRREPQ